MEEQEVLTSMIMGSVALMAFLGIIGLIQVLALWRIFEKAGKPGWAAIVPVYNLIVYLEVVNKPLWWIILLFIPFVNFVFAIIVSIRLAKSFGHGTGFAIGLLLLSPIFTLILAFDKSKYTCLPQ